MQAAKQVGAQAVFIDLPHYAIERPEPLAEANPSPRRSGLLPRPRRSTAAAICTRSP